MRRPIIAGNWKMNLLRSEARDLVESLIRRVKTPASADIILAPPFTALGAVEELIAGTGFFLAGQNHHFEPKGAYTGEVSPAMLKDAGCQYVILGHSERRTYFFEDDAQINKKIKAALLCGLNVIFCVGETLEQREKGETQSIIQSQIEKGLQGLTGNDIGRIVLAYEPVWAIGTGKTATPDQAQEVHFFIRGLLREIFGEIVAQNTRIQYGGSVTPESSGSLLTQKDIDGALVGSASLNTDSFCAIISSAH